MKAASVEPEIVTRGGKPVSVILPIEAYKELLERAENAEEVVRLKEAPPPSLKEYLADRKALEKKTVDPALK